MSGFLSRLLGRLGKSWLGEMLLWLSILYLAHIIGG